MTRTCFKTAKDKDFHRRDTRPRAAPLPESNVGADSGEKLVF